MNETDQRPHPSRGQAFDERCAKSHKKELTAIG